MFSFALAAVESEHVEWVQNEFLGVMHRAVERSSRSSPPYEPIDDASAIEIDPSLDLAVYAPRSGWTVVAGPWGYHMHMLPIAQVVSDHMDTRVVAMIGVDVNDAAVPPSCTLAVFEAGQLVERHERTDSPNSLGELWTARQLPMPAPTDRAARLIRFETAGPWLFLPS